VESFSEEDRRAYLDECSPFDPATSRAMRGWSILTETLRTWPGALRSDHPTASVAAVGKHAASLTADHPLAYGYGAGSPFDKLCQLGGKVLLLGSPTNTVTLLHHAEHIAQLPDNRVVVNKTPVLRNGERTWVEFEEFDTTEGIVADESAEGYFGRIMADYLALGRGAQGQIGQADSYLFDAAGLVAFAVRWMEQALGRHDLRSG
jgi:aminoglycoside 3-N-acetyltransferase